MIYTDIKKDKRASLNSWLKTNKRNTRRGRKAGPKPAIQTPD